MYWKQEEKRKISVIYHIWYVACHRNIKEQPYTYWNCIKQDEDMLIANYEKKISSITTTMPVERVFFLSWIVYNISLKCFILKNRSHAFTSKHSFACMCFFMAIYSIFSFQLLFSNRCTQATNQILNENKFYIHIYSVSVTRTRRLLQHHL